jgi:ribosomal protein L13E
MSTKKEETTEEKVEKLMQWLEELRESQPTNES